MPTHPRDPSTPPAAPPADAPSDAENEPDEDEWSDAATVQMPALPDPDKKPS